MEDKSTTSENKKNGVCDTLEQLKLSCKTHHTDFCKRIEHTFYEACILNIKIEDTSYNRSKR